MSKLSDAELSLAVAKIMWPQYEWEAGKHADVYAYLEEINDCMSEFSFLTDDALGKMCKRMFKVLYDNLDGGEAHIFSVWMLDFSRAMRSDQTNRIVAELLIEFTKAIAESKVSAG